MLLSRQEVLYLPEFVSQDEEVQVLTAVDAAPASRWTNAGERKMQNWGGRPGENLIREVPQTNAFLVLTVCNDQVCNNTDKWMMNLSCICICVCVCVKLGDRTNVIKMKLHLHMLACIYLLISSMLLAEAATVSASSS